MSAPSSPLTRVRGGLTVLLLGLVGLVVAMADVRAARGSDPFGTLLVSKALAEHGTVRLEVLGVSGLEARLGYRRFDRGGHQYYVYPLGTSLLAAPAVAAARLAGVDVGTADGELRVQHTLVVLCAVATVWVLLRLARRLLPFGPAWWCTAAFWSGTSLASVAGAALWSHTAAVLFALLAIDLVVGSECRRRPVQWPWLGVTLFLAYLCRPTMALCAVAVLGWVACRDRRRAVFAAATIAVLLAVFAALSWREFGELLPPYYRMGMEGGAFSTTALAGLLVSPSRGLLTFTPVLLGVWAARGLSRGEWPLHAGWWLVGAGWPVALVAALTRWEMWWGGGCFGPRLLADILPGLFLLTLRAWPVRRPRRGLHWAGLVLLATTALFSSWVHTVQGLFNPWVQVWNAEPSVDTDTWTHFDWRFPQFLHAADRHRARLVAHFDRHPPARTLPPVRPGVPLSPAADVFDAVGFDRMREQGSWTLLQVAELRFVSLPDAPSLQDVTVTFGTNGRQRLRIELGETVLLDQVFDTPAATVTVPLPREGVRERLHRLRFVTPDARRMGRGDARHYGIVVKEVTFR